MDKKKKNVVLPKMDKDVMDEYLMYRQRMDELVQLKKNLSETIEKAAKVNTSYQKYMAQNPHKKERKELAKKIEDLRTQILELIPKV